MIRIVTLGDGAGLVHSEILFMLLSRRSGVRRFGMQRTPVRPRVQRGMLATK
jgi:hypothetical protein